MSGVDGRQLLKEEAFFMDDQRFDTMSQVGARLPDRRNMLKVVAAAALTGVAGTALRTEEASADRNNNNNRKNNNNRQRGFINVAITDLLNNTTVNVPVRRNNVAVQICAVVELIDVTLLGLNALKCEIEQEQ